MLYKSSLSVGDNLPPITRTITQAKMDRFEAIGEVLVSDSDQVSTPANIHTNSATACKMGPARPVASGQMSFAYLHELLARQFGADFRQGGQLSVTFLKPVGPGDTLTARGVVTREDNVGHQTRFTLQVWLENQQGEKTAAGRAKVIVPSPLT